MRIQSFKNRHNYRPMRSPSATGQVTGKPCQLDTFFAHRYSYLELRQSAQVAVAQQFFELYQRELLGRVGRVFYWLHEK
jgi:hypothetical protein